MIRFIQNPPFYVLSKKDSILLIKGVGAGLGTLFSPLMIKIYSKPALLRLIKKRFHFIN
ncbi:hypothetical protein MC7420_1819 [Coleofasciculus chthonoplastes PCC 7420]|uniref:Uncharacterized protein n=1 Tax=Coleofasciculus chthonoplastes PCC 7420 TaxID=118168 RepID=B4VMU7_9CYAN|nr:hypothetical protein MC7420_1819 [Coleofasciculus chthonoplastes PCC 7420]